MTTTKRTPARPTSTRIADAIVAAVAFAAAAAILAPVGLVALFPIAG